LPATGDDRARAGRDDLAAFEQRLDHRVVLPLLEGLPRLVARVLLVETTDVAQRDPALVEVVDKSAAVGAVVGLPAEAVHDLAWADAVLRHLPELLDADRVPLRVAVGVEFEPLHQPLGQVATRALGEHGDL